MKIMLMLLCSITLSLAQNTEYIKKGVNYIEVLGTAELIVPTDKAKLSFTMSANGETLKKSVENTQRKIRVVINKLKDLGMKDKDFETSRFFSNENVGGKSWFTSKNDYKSSLTVTLTFKDFGLLEKAIFIVTESKPNTMSGISFMLEDIEKHKANALKDAANAAYSKAKTLAAASPSKITKLLYSTIQENYYQIRNANSNTISNMRSGRSAEMAYRVDEPSMIHAQNRTIRVTVRAIYQLD